MQLTKPELLVLEQIANGNKSVKPIAIALNKSDKQIYVTSRNLARKGIIECVNGILEPRRAIHVSLLLQMLAKVPNLPEVLADSGIPILTVMLKPVTLDEIIAETGFRRTAIFGKIRQATKRSMIKKRSPSYELNDKLWTPLISFLEELKRYEMTTDPRIPASSVIYYRKDDEIVFSSKEELDAAKTAFSAYKDYGIDLMTITNYYYLPKRKLTKMDILLHSLQIAEKDKDIRSLIYIALFYAKFKSTFRIEHEMLVNLDAVLTGREIKGYPKYQDIKDRAEVYGIKV